MKQKEFVIRLLSRYICTRKIQFPLQNIRVVSFSDNYNNTYLRIRYPVLKMKEISIIPKDLMQLTLYMVLNWEN